MALTGTIRDWFARVPAARIAVEFLNTTTSGICAKVGITCRVLDRRATENYFPDAAVKAEFGPTASGLGLYDEVPTAWKKNTNWKIARHMTRSDLDPTDLGSFLASL